MKRMILALAAFALCSVAAASAQNPIEGGPVPTTQPSQTQVDTSGQQTKTMSENGAGSASAGQASGSFSGSPMSGTFSATYNTPASGCARADGAISLASGSDGLVLGLAGSVCNLGGGAYRFTGTYIVSGGSGAYQMDGTGSGNASFEQSADGAFTWSSAGSFYSRTPRKDGEG